MVFECTSIIVNSNWRDIHNTLNKVISANMTLPNQSDEEGNSMSIIHSVEQLSLSLQQYRANNVSAVEKLNMNTETEFHGADRRNGPHLTRDLFVSDFLGPRSSKEIFMNLVLSPNSHGALSPRSCSSGETFINSIGSPRSYSSSESIINSILSPRPHSSNETFINSIGSPRAYSSSESIINSIISPRPYSSSETFFNPIGSPRSYSSSESIMNSILSHSSTDGLSNLTDPEHESNKTTSSKAESSFHYPPCIVVDAFSFKRKRCESMERSNSVLLEENSSCVPKRWSGEEDELLRCAITRLGQKNWKIIAENIPGRTHVQCLQRWRKVLDPCIRKGHWSIEEDNILLNLVSNGFKNWGHVAKGVPGRCAKQCRERYCNNLDPKVNKGSWAPEEIQLLQRLHRELGNRWSDIARQLPGRTENSVKVKYKTLRKSK